MTASGCRNLLGFWRRLRWLLGALRPLFEPRPHHGTCSRPLLAPPAQLARHFLPVPLLWLLVRLRPLFAVALAWFAGARLAHWRGCPGPLLPTPLPFGHLLSPVRVPSALNPLLSAGARWLKVAAKLNRRAVAPGSRSASTVLAASSVSEAKGEFGSWPPVRKRLLLLTLGLAHRAPFPYR